jgi:hypothetical protein
MINSKGKQDLLVYVLGHAQRYEVANYPNVTIPTNIEVGTNVKENFGEFYEALFSRTTEENPKAVVTEYSWAAGKCDPCPGGILGGAGLNQIDLAKLGNDVIGKQALGWNSPGWTLTRLHARYAPDDIGEDLVFQKAKPIVGGREMYGGTDNAILEKGAKDSTAGNNFQGRYIVRNEWEGEVKCDTPRRGVWGGPPDPNGMRIIVDTVVEERRRMAAAKQGREPTEEELSAPHTAEEREAYARYLRKRFGTSVAPVSAGGETSTAPSANTRGKALSGGVQLASFLKEAIPELKVTPAPPPKEAPAKPTQTTAGAGTTGGAPPAVAPPAEKPQGCRTTGGWAGLDALLLVALVALARRRKRR